MSTAEFLQTLSGLNIKISLDQGNLKINAPKGVMTTALQAQLKSHRDSLVSWLERSPSDYPHQSLPVIIPDNENLYQPFPLSDLQVAFFLANDPFMEFQVRPHYYMENTYTDLDLDRYEAAWCKAIDRHRKEIVLVNAEDRLQTVRELQPFSLKNKINDFRELSTENVFKNLEIVRNKLMREELPLNRWPWFEMQISLWREDNVEKARIHYNNNNFFSDGLGTTRLMNEVWRYYHEPELRLPELKLSFRDAVLGLEQLENSELGQRSKSYWLKRLECMPPALQLPQISGMNRRCRSRLQRREIILPADNWRLFKENASHYGLTTSNAILACYAEVCASWSGSRHFMLSHMMTRRLLIHPQIREILGNFASLYPLEVDFRGEEAFAKRAIRLQEQVLADANQAYWGGMQVMREYNRQKGEMGASPCPFVVGSGIFMGAYKKPEFDCLETAQTLLDHQFWETDDGQFYGVWDLLEEFFPAGMIDSMAEAYKGLLLRLANYRDEWLSVRYDLLPLRDRTIREQCNQTSQNLPIATLHDAINKITDEGHYRSALICGEDTLSYRELSDWSEAVAQFLLDQRIKRGDTVALVMNRGVDLQAAAIGILRAGAAYVPINTELPDERKKYLIENSRVTQILSQAEYVEALTLLTEIPVSTVTALREQQGSTVLPEVSPYSLAYIIYTSGSTGQPKGVAIDHRGALNTIADINQRFNVSSKDKIFGVSSFSFDLSVYDLFGSLAAGATLVYPEPESALNPSSWLEVMSQQNITIWNSAPALMGLLTEAAQRQQSILPNLRLVLLSGDWIPLSLPNAIRTIAPNAQVISLGGATEASIWSICYPVKEVNANWSSIPYGFPLANQRWHIQDQDGYPAPCWTPGELYIAGDGLALGYWGDEIKTAGQFITHPFTGERLYKTGDQGRYLPDGCIEFLGRLDSQVKIQGHRIELGEIESIMRTHPDVLDIVVLAIEIDAAKSKDKELIAYVVSSLVKEAEKQVAIERFQNFLKDRLPLYMMPVAWLMLDVFPINTNGKVDRKALAKLSYTSQTLHDGKEQARTAPRDAIEKALHQIWSKVLMHTSFGVCDDFFELGGKSIDAVRIMGLVQEEFGRAMSLGDMWQQRTIENLSRLLQHGQEKESNCLVTVSQNGSGTPLYLVHPAGGYCMRYAELGSLLKRPVYGFQAVGIDGREPPLKSIKAMAARYIKELLAQQAQEPYCIGGWSSGGLIAFEMATQLIQQGKTVTSLFILDCPSPHEHAPVNDSEMLYWFLEDLAMDLPLSVLEGVDWANLNQRQQLEKAATLLHQHAAVSLHAASLLPIYLVFREIVSAGRNYYPSEIDLKIILCRASDGIVSEFSHHPYSNNKDWGWALLSKSAVTTYQVTGSHHTILNTGNVERIADILNDHDLD